MHTRLPYLVSLALSAASAAFAAAPTWNVINANLDATFGNAGKGVLDPQVTGFGGVAFGAGIFVAVGNSIDENVVRWATSPDGITWTAHSQPTPTSYTTYQTSKVHFLNGKFIFFTGFGGGGGSVSGTTWCYSSTDGLSWTANKVADTRINVTEFDASPALYVAAAHNGNQVSSTDLVTWTPSPVVPDAAGFDHNDLAYGAGHFISTINGFGGQTYASTNGTTWAPLAGQTGPGGGYIASGNGVFLLAFNADYRRSTDGETFSAITPTVPTNWLLGGSPTFAGGRFLASSFCLIPFKSAFLASTDGLSWTEFGDVPVAPAVPAGQSRGYFFADVAYGNGKYVFVGTDTAQTLLTKTVLPLIVVGEADAATYTPPPSPPAITTQPASLSAVAGHGATFTVAAQNDEGLTYQWKHDGIAIAGATAASYTIAEVSPADAGAYTVEITNSAGTTASAAASLTLVAPSESGHIVNVSIRGDSGPGDNALIVGTVVVGSSPKPLLIRAVGPSLADLGVTAPLADPQLRLVAQGSGTTLASNDNWAGDADIAQVSAAVGAFALPTASKDAALFSAGIATGPYSVVVTEKNNGSGPTLAEVYDAEDLGAYNVDSGRLVNISGRGHVGAGDKLLVAGFVVAGSTPVRVLVRGVGPTLADFGVTGPLPDPQLQLFQSGTSAAIATNDNWGGNDAAEIATLASTVGAFELPADSKDAALLITLQPGVYTVHLTGVGGATGVGLIEVYEVPN